MGQRALGSDLKGVETIASDGSYYSPETIKIAEEKKIELSFSALNGRRAPEDELGANEFAIVPDTQKITGCPGRGRTGFGRA